MEEIASENSDIKVIVGDDSITVTEDMGLSDDANLKIQGQNVSIKNGKFEIPSNIKDTKLNYSISDEGTGTTSGTTKNDGSLNIVNKIDYNSMIDDMNNQRQPNSTNEDNNGINLIKAPARYGSQKMGNM